MIGEGSGECYSMVVVRTGCLAVAILVTALSSAQMSAKEIYARYQDSVVTVEVSTKKGVSSGTGFILSNGQYVATCYQNLEDGFSISLKTSKGIYPFPDAIKVDRFKELVLIKLKETAPTKGIPLTFEKQHAVGSEVSVIGNPLGLERSLSSGIVSSYRWKDAAFLVQVTAPISPGSSGSPIIDSEGKCIGMATSYLADGQNINLGLATFNIRRTLESETEQTLSEFWQSEGKVKPPSVSDGGNKLTEEKDKIEAKLKVSAELSKLMKVIWQYDNEIEEQFASDYLNRRYTKAALWQLSKRAQEHLTMVGDVLAEIDGRDVFTSLGKIREDMNLVKRLLPGTVLDMDLLLISNHFGVDGQRERETKFNKYLVSRGDLKEAYRRLLASYCDLKVLGVTGFRGRDEIEVLFRYQYWFGLCMNVEGLNINQIKGKTVSARKEFSVGDLLLRASIPGDGKEYQLKNAEGLLEFLSAVIVAAQKAGGDITASVRVQSLSGEIRDISVNVGVKMEG